MKFRDNSLDSVGSILILFMIIGHAFQWSHTHDSEVYESLRRFLFFFMAFFFYKSGMFYHRMSLKDVLIRGLRKFITPFLIYMLLGEIVRWIRLYIQEGDTNVIHYFLYTFISVIGRGGPSGNVPLWFLLALFLTQIVVSISDKYRVPRITLFFVAFLIAGMCAIFQSFSILEFLPPIIAETSLGILFFLFGSYMKELQYEKRVFVVSIIVYLLVVLFIPSYVDFRKGALSNGCWLVWVISTLAGIIVFINVFRPLLSTKNR